MNTDLSAVSRFNPQRRVLNPGLQQGQQPHFIFHSVQNEATCAIMISHTREVFFSVNHAEFTTIHHQLINFCPQQLEFCFTQLNHAIEHQQIPATVYENILLSTFQRKRLLSYSFHRNNDEASQTVLKYAEMAHTKKWLKSIVYHSFLVHHPLTYSHFSYIHESLLSNHYKNVYAYVGACLRAILNNNMSLDTFVNILQQKNHPGYSVLQQSINNDFLETTELMLNLFNRLLPNQYAKNLLQFNRQKLKCDYTKNNPHVIASLLYHERRRVKNGIPKIGPIVYHTPNRILSSEFNELMNLLDLIVIQKEKAAMAKLLSPASISTLYETAARTHDVRFFSSPEQHSDAERPSLSYPLT